MMKAWVLAFALLAERAIAREVLGAIHLDAYTFDKVVAYHDVFVKFDKYIPYGPKEDAFRELAKQVGELSTDLLIGWIGVQDYGACGRAASLSSARVIVSPHPAASLSRSLRA